MRHKKIIQEILGKELEKRDLLMSRENFWHGVMSG